MTRSSLGRHIVSDPTPDHVIARMAREAWMEQGAITIRPPDMDSRDRRRAAALRIGRRLYGSESPALTRIEADSVFK